jgi:DNA-binding response OmpR family regulator
LKKRGIRWSSVPVIITTTLTVASDVWANSLGAVSALRKPIDIQVLLEKVGKLLGSGTE